VKKEYVEIEGIRCEVKNPAKKSIVRFYQQTLRPEIDKYVGNNIMTDKRKAYAEALEINLIIAPFVLGWLKKPEDEDEYRVIKGQMTLKQLEASRNLTVKKPRKAPAKKITEPIKPIAETKKLMAPKKPVAPKKPAPPKKPTVKSIAEKQDSKGPVKGQKVAEKKVAPVSKKPVSPTKPIAKKKGVAPIKGASKGPKKDSTAQKPAPAKKTPPKK
jgi:hypothetical protein